MPHPSSFARWFSRREALGGMCAMSLAGTAPTRAAERPRCPLPIELDGSPGVAAGLVNQGKVIAMEAHGVRDIAAGGQVDENLVFEIGSLTKTFTAALIFMLEEQGRLSSQSPVGRYVANIPAAWRDVRLVHLLSHTSGLPEYLDQHNFRSLISRDVAPRDIISIAVDRPNSFAPGERFSYNNLGYILLGMVVEAVSGQNYWKHLRDKLLLPVGMHATGPAGSTGHDFDVASGHFWEGDAYDRDPPRTAPGSTWSAGGLVSTAADLCRWAIALDRGEILSSAVCAKMWSPARLNNGELSGWGHGWAIDNAADGAIVSHGGGTAGFSCWFRRDLSGPSTVIVLTNQNGRADPKLMADRLAASRLADNGLLWRKCAGRKARFGRSGPRQLGR